MSQKIDVDTKTFFRFWLTLLAIVAIGFLIFKAWGALIIIFASIFLSIALTPLANKIDRIDRGKERKNLSRILAVVIVIVGIFGIIAIVGPVIIEQVSKFLGKAPTEISNFLNSADLSGIEKFIGSNDLKTDIIQTVGSVANDIKSNLSAITFSSISAISSTLTNIVFVIVLTIFFMLQGKTLSEPLWKLLSDHDAKKTKIIHETVDKIANVISIYVSRQMFIAVLDGVVSAVIVLLLSLFSDIDSGFAIPVGLISALCYLIPMFGPIISSVLNTLLLVITSPIAAIIYLVIYIIYAQIEANVIAPKIQGQGLGLSPLIILIAIILGMYTFGFIGCIIAIPIAGCIKVIIDEFPKLRSLSEK